MHASERLFDISFFISANQKSISTLEKNILFNLSVLLTRTRLASSWVGCATASWVHGWPLASQTELGHSVSAPSPQHCSANQLESTLNDSQLYDGIHTKSNYILSDRLNCNMQLLRYEINPNCNNQLLITMCTPNYEVCSFSKKSKFPTFDIVYNGKYNVFF